jgi:glycosyltransferase involved in cell wall biosynthesis
MRIGFVCNEYPPDPHGGIGSFVHTMSRALSARGHAVHVIGFSDRPGPRRDEGVQVELLERCRRRGIAWLRNRWMLKRRLERLASVEGLQVVEVPDFEGWLPFGVDGPSAVIVRLHQSSTALANASGLRPPPGIRTLEGRMLRRHSSWIAPSVHALNLTSATFGVRPRLAEVIPNPIGAARPAEPPPVPWAGRFVLFAGSVSERKGALALARAARSFLGGRPDVALVFAGAETEHGGRPISAAIREPLSQAADRVFFTGRLSRDATRALMSRASVFAIPSRIESFGLVAAEAMAEGVPVVVPRTGPFDELVESEKTGVTFPIGDDEALARAIGGLLDDRPRARAIGEAARRDVACRLSVERAVNRTLAFYHRAMSGGGEAEGGR